MWRDVIVTGPGSDVVRDVGRNDLVCTGCRGRRGPGNGGNSLDTIGRWDLFDNELFGGPGSDYLVGDGGNDRLDGGAGFDHGQGGYRDVRIDWIDSLEHLIEECLTYDEMRAFLAPDPPDRG